MKRLRERCSQLCGTNMPRLLAFMACEKVIVDKDSGNISLISFLQEVKVPLPKEHEPIPENALAPFYWCAFSFWVPDDDQKRDFELKSSVLSPDGRVLLESPPIKFLMGEQGGAVLNKFQAFPVSAEGKCSLALYFRHDAREEWNKKSEAPITVKYVDSTEGKPNL
jgi:hypothetical protein